MARRKPAARPPGAAAAGRVDLGSELSIRTVGTAREQLRACLDDASRPVQLGAASVERVDTAGLQLLCAFTAALAAAGRPLAWQEPSPALRAAAATVGLAGALALPAPA